MPTPEASPGDRPLVARHRSELMVSPQAAWRLISEGDLLATWYAFGGARVEPVAGGALELSWEDGKVFRGQVEQAEPPHTLTYRLPQEAGVAVGGTNSTTVILRVGPSSHHAGRSIIEVAESGFERLDPRYTPFESFKAAQLAWIGAFGLLVQATGIPPQEDSTG